MDIRPIRTETDYKASLKTISRLMESDPDLGTPEGDRLDVLTTLVQAYEAKHFQIDLPDPVEAIKPTAPTSTQSTSPAPSRRPAGASPHRAPR